MDQNRLKIQEISHFFTYPIRRTVVHAMDFHETRRYSMALRDTCNEIETNPSENMRLWA